MLADVLCRKLGEFLAALLIELDVDDVLVVFRVHARLRAGQAVAANTAEPLYRDQAAFTRCARGKGINLASGRRNARLDVLNKRVLIDQFEFELRGLAQQVLQRLGVLQAGNLHYNPGVALSNDRRLARAEIVDTAAHDLGRAFHGIVDGVVDPALRRCQHQSLGVDHLEIPFAHKVLSLHHRFEDAARAVDIAHVVEHEGQLVARGRNVTDADARFGIPHGAAHRLFHVLEPLGCNLVGLRLKQEVRTAGKVEAEIDHRRRQRCRPVVAGHAVKRRHGGEHRNQRDQPQADFLP